jgi:hypothetical protein
MAKRKRQRPTKQTHKTKDWVTRAPLKEQGMNSDAPKGMQLLLQ